jgi:NAD(P)-dependent dehydrogenase (short-subunit alcohol dehydrogenase family)
MNSTFNYKGKTVIVTGGGSGIGQSIAVGFALNGANVFIIDLNEEGSQATVASITKEAGWAKAVKCNVADQANVKSVIESIYKETKRIDVLINNAGIAHVGTLETTSEEDFDRIFQVNVKGVYNVMHEVIGIMKNQGGGVILNMASIAATSGIPDRFAYSMSKGAVLTMTLSVARDYLKDNIRCNSISPARVHTPFVDGFISRNYPGQEAAMFDKLSKAQPIGRMGKPEEVASLALYLCSDQASFITGCDYLIDGGYTTLR